MRFLFVFICWFLVLSCGSSECRLSSIKNESTVSQLRPSLKDTFLKLNKYDVYPSHCHGHGGQPSFHLKTTSWFIKNINNDEAWLLLKDSNPLMKAIAVVRLSRFNDTSFIRMFDMIYADSINFVDQFFGCVGEPTSMLEICLTHGLNYPWFFMNEGKWTAFERNYVDSLVKKHPNYEKFGFGPEPNDSNTAFLILPKPTKDFFTKHRNSAVVEYEYFKEYLDAGNKKEILKNFEGTGEPCGWKQSLKNDIVFEYEDCQEVGRNVKIIFPGYSKKELMNFVMWFFETDENKWNEEQTTYSPIEGEAGCYFEILKDSDGSYILDYYCGC